MTTWESLSDIDHDDILSRYDQGESSAAIARDYGVSVVGLRRWIRRAGHPTRRAGRPHGYTAFQIRTAVKAHAMLVPKDFRCVCGKTWVPASFEDGVEMWIDHIMEILG